jgi:hypothetical protein
MRTGFGLLAVAVLLALTGCGGGPTVSVPAGIPANFTSILRGLNSAVTETGSDLSNERIDASTGPNNRAGTCVNVAANIDYDVKTIIDHDRQNVIDQVNNLKDAIAVVRQDIANFQYDIVAIVNQAVPSPSGASSTIAWARLRIQLAIGTANTDIDQVNNYVHAAYTLANHEASGKCSPNGPGGEPGKIGHLS